jgi:asparagine synthetase B (glutamine-hydrolysing)
MTSCRLSVDAVCWRRCGARDIFSEHRECASSASVVVAGEAIRTQRYWDFDLTREIRFAHIDDYAGAFRQHFELAVRRRLRSAAPVAVSVSGGLIRPQSSVSARR